MLYQNLAPVDVTLERSQVKGCEFILIAALVDPLFNISITRILKTFDKLDDYQDLVG